MADIRVRNVDENVRTMLRLEAKAAGVTMEEYMRQGLRELAFRRRKAVVEEMRRNLEEMRRKYGVLEDSALGIREERDARG